MKERNRNPKEQCEINFFSLLPYPFFPPFSVLQSTLSLSTTPKTLTTIPHIPHRPSPFPDFSFKELAGPKNPFPLNLEINFSSKLFPCSKRPLCFRLPNHINLWFLSLWLYVCMYVCICVLLSVLRLSLFLSLLFLALCSLPVWVEFHCSHKLSNVARK